MYLRVLEIDRHTGRRKLHVPAVDLLRLESRALGIIPRLDMRKNDTANFGTRGKGTCTATIHVDPLDGVFLSKTCFTEKKIYPASAFNDAVTQISIAGVEESAA